MSKKVIFIGGIGDKKTFGGELTKNKYIIKRLEELGKKVLKVDTYKSRKKIYKLWNLPFVLLFYPKSTLIISSSMGNIYFIIKFLFHFRLKKNVIYWGIGGLFPTLIKEGKYNKKYFEYLKVIIVEGDKMKDTLLESGISNVITMPNFKSIDYIPHKDYSAKEKTRFVFLSRVIPDKGVDYIIEVVRKLNEEGLNNKFIVDFYGGIESYYKEKFLKDIYLLDNVNYCGSLDLSLNKNIDKLSSYDIMLFPTYWKGEGFPGVVIDAYIAGLPIIASDWSLNTEFIIDNETGFIVETHNVESLYKSMISSIENPEIINKMSINCQARAMSFDVNTLITKEFVGKYKI